MSLQAGQVVRYDNALWRVDYVNECRARIVPLAKRHVTLNDGREFDSEQRGVNISPNAEVPVVDNLDRAKIEIELAEAEAELAQARAEVAKEEARVRKAATPSPKASTIHVPKAEAQTKGPQTAGGKAEPIPSKGIGWRLGLAQPEHLRQGSLKRWVFDFVTMHPGQTTKQVAEGVKLSGANMSAVAACLDRFRKINVMVKS